MIPAPLRDRAVRSAGGLAARWPGRGGHPGRGDRPGGASRLSAPAPGTARAAGEPQRPSFPAPRALRRRGRRVPGAGTAAVPRGGGEPPEAADHGMELGCAQADLSRAARGTALRSALRRQAPVPGRRAAGSGGAGWPRRIAGRPGARRRRAARLGEDVLPVHVRVAPQLRAVERETAQGLIRAGIRACTSPAGRRTPSGSVHVLDAATACLIPRQCPWRRRPQSESRACKGGPTAPPPVRPWAGPATGTPPRRG